VTLLFSISQSHHKDTTQFTRWVCLEVRSDEWTDRSRWRKDQLRKLALRSAEECRMITLHHRTTEGIARPAFGSPNAPLDANEGASGNALLRVELSVADQ
jgi:hypothetical protein